MEQPNEEEARELFQESLARVLRDPHGYAVIRKLLEESLLFVPAAPPEDDPPLRVFLDNFFRDIEQADPQAALRLFADLRGIPYVTGKQANEQE